MKLRQFNKANPIFRTPAEVVFLFSLLIFVSFCCTAYGLTVDSVLATVGDEIITFKDYKQFARVSGVDNPTDVDQTVLKKMLEEKVIVQEAKRKGYDVTDKEVEGLAEEFKTQNGLSKEDMESFLKDQGLDMKAYRATLRDKVLVSKVVGGDVDSKVIVREQEIEDYYKNNESEFLASAEKVEVKAIFLKLRDDATVTELTDLKRRALRIAALLKDGYNFDSLVEEYSDEPLKSRNGELGKFSSGGLIRPLDKKVSSMKKGEISDPVWVSEGAYILMVVGRSAEAFKTLDEVRSVIREKLVRQKRDRIYNEWIKDLWEKSLVTIK